MLKKSKSLIYYTQKGKREKERKMAGYQNILRTAFEDRVGRMSDTELLKEHKRAINVIVLGNTAAITLTLVIVFA